MNLKDKVEERKVGKLVPYVNNPKEHPEKQIEKLASSIKEFGFTVPIIIKQDNEIIAGHGRLEAAKKLGMEKIPVIVRDDLTDAQAKAFRLADNKLTESEWDEESLAVELEQLNESSLDLGSTGFDDDEFSDLLDDFEGNSLEDPESESPDKVETDIEEGDVYKLGDHFLMCGDATDKEDVSKLMQGEKADMVFTDPPYGMFLETDFSSMKSSFKGKDGGNNYEAVKGDNDDFKPELITSIFDYFEDCKEVFIWGFDYFAELIPDRNNGAVIVWDKRLDDSADKMYGSSFELCWSKQKHKRDIKRVKWAGLFGMEKEHDDERKHPTQKPVELCSSFLKEYGENQDKVVDVYAGSGSTLLAAEQLDRKAYCMELDPQYCQVIINRWEELTGKTAEKVV